MELTGLQEIIKTDTDITLTGIRGKIRRVYNTAVSGAITVTYGMATLALEAGEGAVFRYDGSAWYADALLSAEKVAELLYTPTDIVIATQEEFDKVFTGTIAENTSIYIVKPKDNTPYLLNNEVTLGSGVKITSDGAVVNRGTATARFVTSYKNRTEYSSGGAPGDTTIARTAGTPFEAGDIISWSHTEFYTVVSDTSTANTWGTVTVTPAIHDTASAGTIYAYSQKIHTEGWTFDGQNNVNGMGGSFTSGFSGSGGAFYIPYCAGSQFLAKVQNCNATSYGGAYYGDSKTFNNSIAYTEYCSAFSGGACSRCNYSTVYNINYCTASYGGACYSCYYSTIYNIAGCAATYGGACNGCNYSTIYNISYCTASYGGACCCDYSTIYNITGCSATSNGGGCYGCDYSTISKVTSCSAGYSGGACSACRWSTIFNIGSCTARYGGGCNGCYFSTIYNITGCSATYGGACYGCDYSTISQVTGCTAPTGSALNTGGVASSSYITLQGYFDNEGYVDNIGGCTYIGKFVYKNNTGTMTTVTTTGLTSADCH